MARLHLRLGSLELARAELESFAGAGALDADALLDLAEVRWRTGDLPGAGVAAQAYLGEGGGAALALVIAAEASAAMGRPTEARRLAAQAQERADVPLERLFAGIPRSGIWPMEPQGRAEPAGELFAIPATPAAAGRAGGADRDGSTFAPPAAGQAEADGASFAVPAFHSGPGSGQGEALLAGGDANGLGDRASPSVGPAPSAEPAPAPATWSLWETSEDPAGAPPRRSEALPPAPDPLAELAAAHDDLAAGRGSEAAARLAIALRLAPSLAPDVLDAIGERGRPSGPGSASLELVRGDAFRLVGREVEARRSYAAASAALAAGGRDALEDG